ncbi:hypothetical protein ABK040_000037 [Willaertia magna]
MSNAFFALSAGSNSYSQSCHDPTISTVKTFTSITLINDIIKHSSVKKMACGREHTMILLNNGQLFGIGHNQHGQIYGTSPETMKELTEIDVRQFISDDDKIIDVFCTQINTYLITKNHKVYWSGWENTDPLKSYLQVNGLPKNREIIYFETNSNAVHCFLITDMDEIYSVGWNSNGQLALGNTTDSYGEFKKVDIDGKDVKFLTGGAQFSVLVTKNDIFKACGINGDNQLSTSYSSSDNCSFVTVDTPFQLPIKRVNCGGFHTIVQLSNGELFGSGKYFSTGVFSRLKFDGPTPTNIVEMASGWQFAILLSDEGVIYSQGNNEYCQLGIEETEDKELFIPLENKVLHAKNCKIDCGEHYCIIFRAFVETANHFIFMESLLSEMMNEQSERKPNEILCDISFNAHTLSLQ